MEEKKRKRRLERRWRRSKSIGEIYRNQRNRYNRILNEVYTRYLSNLVSENSRDPKALFKTINTLLNKKEQSPLPGHSSASELSATFNTHFIDKVTLIHHSLEEINHTQNIVVVEERRYKIGLCNFNNISEKDVLRLIKNAPKKSCSIDPMSTWLLVQCQSSLIPIITTINSSINDAICIQMQSWYRNCVTTRAKRYTFING